MQTSREQSQSFLPCGHEAERRFGFKYIAALVLIPLTAFPTRFSLLYSGYGLV